MTAPILFIADSHLRGPDDANQHALLGFLRERGPQPGGLVVVGDLFDFMAGYNRTAIDAYREVLEVMARFEPLHYLEGNHDFDLSPEMPGMEQAGIWPGPASLQLNQRSFRVLHGDRTSPGDFGTRILRWGLQSTPIRFARDYLLPDRFVFQFALSFATLSRQKTWPGRANETHSALEHAHREGLSSGAEVVVFAHTHRPLLVKEGDMVIANPGPAVPGGSYLEMSGDRLCLHRFPDGKILGPGPLKLRRRHTEPRQR